MSLRTSCYIVGVSALLALCGTTHAVAAEGSRMRPASAHEINTYLNTSKKGYVAGADGYIYNREKKVGYRITNGQMCVRYSARKTDCADIKTDGDSFQMITRDGQRSKF